MALTFIKGALEEYAKKLNIEVKDPTELLDALFRNTLQEVWPTI